MGIDSVFSSEQSDNYKNIFINWAYLYYRIIYLNMQPDPKWSLYYVPVLQTNFVYTPLWLFPQNCKIQENDSNHYIPQPCSSGASPPRKINEEPLDISLKKRGGKSSYQAPEESDFSMPQQIQGKHFEQKSGRNSASNILRTFTKFVKLEEFKQAYEIIKKKNDWKITFKQFFSWMAGAGFSAQRYVRIKKIMKGIRSKPHHGKIVAILYKYFQAKFARPMILTSTKTDQKNKIPTLRQVRKIGKGMEKALLEGFKNK